MCIVLLSTYFSSSLPPKEKYPVSTQWIELVITELFTHPFLPSVVCQTLLETTLCQAYFQVTSLGLVREGLKRPQREVLHSRAPGMRLSLIYALPF